MGSLVKLWDGQGSKFLNLGKVLPWMVANSNCNEFATMIAGKEKQKKPASAFGLFYAQRLPYLRKQHPNMPIGQVMKLASAMWKTESAFTQNRYRAEYNRKMEEYKKNLPEVPTPPRRPAPAFPQFVSEINASLMKQMPNSTLGERQKRAGELWRNLPEERKLKYQSAYQSQMETYKKNLTQEDIDSLQRMRDTRQAKREQAKADQEQKDLKTYGKYGISVRPHRPRLTPMSLYIAEQSSKQGQSDKEAMKGAREKWTKLNAVQKGVYEKKVDEVMKKFDKDFQAWEKKFSKYESAMKERPSRPLNPYTQFVRLNAQQAAGSGKDFIKTMGERWTNLSEQQKKPYVAKFETNLVTYRKDMEKWEQKFAHVLGK